MSPSENGVTDAVGRVADLLRSAAKPMTFGQLKTLTHWKQDTLRSALETAASQGLVFRWPDFRRRQSFWFRSPDDVAHEAILAIASDLALSRTSLIAQARKRVPGFAPQALARIVAGLLSDQQLQEVPAFTAGKLVIRSGAVAAYAATARTFIEQRFRKAGLDPAQFSMPQPSQGDSAELILEAVRSLEPVTGVPVSAQRLRSRLPALRKSAFDAAAIELRKRQQVFLSLHHDPHNLSAQERDLLIDGGDGTYYVAIAIR